MDWWGKGGGVVGGAAQPLPAPRAAHAACRFWLHAPDPNTLTEFGLVARTREPTLLLAGIHASHNIVKSAKRVCHPRMGQACGPTCSA